jgi:hypothetical protein
MKEEKANYYCHCEPRIKVLGNSGWNPDGGIGGMDSGPRASDRRLGLKAEAYARMTSPIIIALTDPAIL